MPANDGFKLFSCQHDAISWSYLGSFVVAVSAMLAGCNRSTQNAADPPAAATAAASAAKSIDPDHPVVQIETTAGPITIRLDAVRAPGTVSNFLNYVNDEFYDNTIIHFVDPGKLLVAGGYTIDHKPKSGHIPIRNEAHNGRKNLRGTVAMARDQSRIDSATTQFFINLADAPNRDHTGDTPATYGYCVFGEVIEGLDTADRISHSPTTDQGGDLVQTPSPPVVIKSIRAAR